MFYSGLNEGPLNKGHSLTDGIGPRPDATGVGMRSMFGGCSIETIVNAMTIDEKVGLVSGHGLWKTAINYRHEIPEIVMTDGTYGVRYAADQIDGTQAGRNELDQLLAVVARRQADPVTAQFGVTRPATCFPNGSSFACSWNVDLAYEFG